MNSFFEEILIFLTEAIWACSIFSRLPPRFFMPTLFPALNPSPILIPSFFVPFREILMQRKSVAWCQFNLDAMTSVCLSQTERERDREEEWGRWTFNPLSVLNYLSLFHLSVSRCLSVYSIHLSESWSSKLPLCCRLEHFYVHFSLILQISTILPPPLSSSLLSAPSARALPSPSLGPPARSFPRTACSQHPPPD